MTWGGPSQFLWHLWNHIPMDNVNKTLAVHSLTTLALCYLPGVIAGWLQIFRGTKYSRFPTWLDNWLKMRKQLGLLMLFAASIHVRKTYRIKEIFITISILQACLSVAYMAPRYNDLIYGEPVQVSVHVMEGEGWGVRTESENRTVVKVYGGEKMTWQGECFLMSGVFGFALVVLLGISSLPSVSAVLTWKEFAFIQSGLGWVAMILLCAHDMFYGWKYMDGPSCGIPSSFQVRTYSSWAVNKTLLSVRSLHSISDNSAEAPSCAPSLFNSPHENKSGICAVKKHESCFEIYKKEHEAAKLIRKCVRFSQIKCWYFVDGFSGLRFIDAGCTVHDMLCNQRLVLCYTNENKHYLFCTLHTHCITQG